MRVSFFISICYNELPIFINIYFGGIFMKTHCVILIPALDPPFSFKSYLEELIEAGFEKIIVVDDGSSDKRMFQEIESYSQIIVLTHEHNFGKGKALRTGLQYYKEHFDYQCYYGIVTADSDGQHLCGDVIKVAQYLEESSENLILGVRDFDQNNVPFKSRFGNKVTSLIFRLVLGISVSDTQTGLRGIPNNMIDMCLSIGGDRFEYETAMLIEAAHEHKIQEETIHTVYYEENKGTHFHPIKDSIKIYKLLFQTFLSYVLVALSSFLIDITLFAFCSKVVLTDLTERIIVSTIIARILSGTYNYLMNRNIVFASKQSYSSTAVQYLMLCIIQMFCSAFLLKMATVVLHLDEVIMKVIIDTILFFVSYAIQKCFIFKKRNEYGKKN